MHTDIIRFDHVAMGFDKGPRVFSDLTLSIAEGSFHFLTGSSGAGKTTLLRMVYLGLKQLYGDVYLFGRNSAHVRAREVPFIRRKIGVVFQDFRLINHLHVLDNVALPLKVRGLSLQKARRQAAEILKWAGLGEALWSLPSSLSGGEQQRVAIARAVIGRPKILLADEPTGNVDEDIAIKLMYLFQEMHKAGTTVIVATHNRMLARRFKYPEIFLSEGKARIIPYKEVRKDNG